MVNENEWFLEPMESKGTLFGLKLDGERLHAEQSAFQHIEIYQTETFGKLMVIDGCVMLTDRDNFLYHEMIAHPALCLHPNPRRVLIIGGGDCGTLREVLRHPQVESAVQVDIDERVTRLAEEYFPALCDSNDDARAQLLFDDGIAYVRNAADQAFDLIIVDSTDPVGPAEGLFNRAFYAQCHRALADDGILVQQSESPLIHLELIQQVHASMKGEGFAATRLVNFPQPVYPSGWWSATLAFKQAEGAQRQADSARVEAISADTLYFNAATLNGALALPNFVAKALAEKA
ncbi:polyamine aminopropyltransferase [Oceanococcus atlanticus]|nr:polyamine aminopropyltransferase [Oceanococcus atlanticus]